MTEFNIPANPDKYVNVSKTLELKLRHEQEEAAMESGKAPDSCVKMWVFQDERH